MPRYLSPAWLAQAAGAPLESPVRMVLEQVVEGTPDGTVTYRVEVADDGARILWPVPGDAPAADLRITTGWATAVAVARGQLSTQRALMQGRLRVSGTPGHLGDAAASLAGVDPVPAGVRAATTFDGG
jgi:hypothetical protein